MYLANILQLRVGINKMFHILYKLMYIANSLTMADYVINDRIVPDRYRMIPPTSVALSLTRMVLPVH